MGRKRTINLDLPPGIYAKRDGYYFRRPDRTEWRVAPLTEEGKKFAIAKQQSIKQAEQLAEEKTIQEAYSYRRWYFVNKAESFEDLPWWAKELYRKTRNGAKSRQLSFAISPHEFFLLLKNSRGRCAVSGVEFNLMTTTKEERTRAVRRPFFPSIDRIDSTLGYAIDNIRIVCVAVNYAMNFWGEDVLRTISSGVIEQLKKHKKAA